MDNQQERSNGLEYAAGVVVGEGCFTICIRTHRKGRISFCPVFALSMNDRETVFELARIFRENGLPWYISQRKNRKTWEFRANGYKRVKRVTEALLPYLTGDKKKSADLVNRFVNSRLSQSPKAPPSEEEICLLVELREHLGNRKYKIPSEILRDYTPNFGRKDRG